MGNNCEKGVLNIFGMTKLGDPKTKLKALVRSAVSIDILRLQKSSDVKYFLNKGQ